MTMLLNDSTPIGTELPLVAGRFTVEMFTAGGIKTIHNDQAAAEREGLAAPIAIGPQVAALIFRMLRSTLREGWIVGGRSALTFRRPVPIGDLVVARGVLTGREPDGEDVRLTFDVWVELPDGTKPIVGSASGLVPRRTAAAA